MRTIIRSEATAATVTTEFLEVNGNRIGYRVVGDGSPLILLTRTRGTLDTWDPLFLDNLAHHHQVVTVDYPGVGYSGGTLPTDLDEVAEFVETFAKKLGFRRFAVLGWSWGGIIAQVLLLRSPEMISHAVLVGTAPPGPGQAEIQKVWLERALKPVNDLDDEEILFFEPRCEASRRAAKRSHERIHERPGVTARIPSTREAIDRYFVSAQSFRQDAERRRTQLTRSSVPMLIVCGDNDPSVPATNWYDLVGRIPLASLLVLPQAGHGPQHQYPELTAKHIVAFLEDQALTAAR